MRNIKAEQPALDVTCLVVDSIDKLWEYERREIS